MERSDAPAGGLWFVVGEITDKQRSPHWHESGHRCDSHDSTSAGESELEDSNLVVATRSTPVAGRPADAAAGDAPTVTRHVVEQRELIVVPASSGAPLQAGSGEGISAPSSPVPNLLKPTVVRAQPSSAAVESSHHPCGDRVDSSGPGGGVPMEVAQAVEPTTKSRAPVEEHDESLVPERERERGRPATHCWPSPGSPEYTVGCPGCDGRSCRHLLKCQQKTS